MKTSDAIAAASLVIAVFALGYTVWATRRERTNRREEIKNVLQARRAVIVAATTTPQTSPGSKALFGSPKVAINLSNAGRASAQRITAELLDAQERQLSKEEIDLLPPDQTQYVEFVLLDEDPVDLPEEEPIPTGGLSLRVEWTDDDGAHSEQFAL